ncbi:MAG: hypothetical protein JW841_06675 [Deltaproteobacteria bacterium]|nr:hypothetical protein [Deltaproteobacteria bacterium]
MSSCLDTATQKENQLPLLAVGQGIICRSSQSAKTNELKLWLLKNSGKTSMVRKGLGYLREGKTLASDLLSLMTYNRYKNGPIPGERFPIGLEKPDEFSGDPEAAYLSIAANPEHFDEAKERKVIEHLNYSINAMDKALLLLLNGKSITPKNIEVKADPILDTMAKYSVSS